VVVVYSDSPIIDREWLPKIDFDDAVRICHSLSEYRDATADYRIAFTAHRLHVEHDADMQFENKMKVLSDVSDLVFVIESELHQFHWSIWGFSHRPNVYWCQPGTVNDRDDFREHIIPWQDWFKTTADLYRRLPDTLSRLQPYDAKPRSFDALLGSPKPHRKFVADSIEEHGLQEKFISTYGGQWDNRTFYARDYFIFEPGTELIDPLIGTCDWVRYQGHQCHLSQVMPVDVYNQTAYSIVAETDADNSLSFFSEKTAKPLIARRLFVAFTGYKFLSNLRELGFQTFGSVIDESYDDIFNSRERYQVAFDQVRRLCEMDQRKVLKKIQPILEHNHQWIMQTDWTQLATDQISTEIKKAAAG
jgi:hypothetical protein